MKAESLVGRIVDDYRVIGEERDGEAHWTGADLELRIIPNGRFLIRVVTKAAFADQHLGDYLNATKNIKPEDVLDQGEVPTKPPFVLNDTVITNAVLDRKFKNRIVTDDLATAMWPIVEDGDQDQAS